MAPLRIRHVVSFTSQDPDHPAQGLLAGERWLCDPSDRSGLMRAELQLELASLIAYIDIGTVGVGLLQVEVGRSSWAQDTALLTLLPTTVLLSAAQSKAKHNETSVRMFNSENFTREVMAERWDRVRFTCTQPFHKSNPFGVTFISFRTSGDSDQVTELVQPSCPATPRQSVKTKDCEDRVSSKPWLALPAIRRTFFTPTERNERVEKLKERLSRLAPKSKSGCVDEKALPRTARLLLTAAAHYSATDGSLPPIKANSHAAQSSSSPIGESRSRDLSVRRLATTARTPPAVECGVQQATGAAVTRLPVEPHRNVKAGPDPNHTRACPMCSGLFNMEQLLVHAATCGAGTPSRKHGPTSSTQPPARPSSYLTQTTHTSVHSVTEFTPTVTQFVSSITCPICRKEFPPRIIEQHASQCGEDPD
uniref:Zgc:110224 n=1 Tax=Petromyzon marinus TaxID=7757 RepID=S4RCM6_PETMA